MNDHIVSTIKYRLVGQGAQLCSVVLSCYSPTHSSQCKTPASKAFYALRHAQRSLSLKSRFTCPRNVTSLAFRFILSGATKFCEADHGEIQPTAFELRKSNLASSLNACQPLTASQLLSQLSCCRFVTGITPALDCACRLSV